jgi:3-phosphoshikimate 1-carboxyvinyltransferase
MALPDLIEIVPLDKPVRAEITVPGSKSITNRALILAALADGEVTLVGALWSEDTQIMVECLQELGFMVNVELDPDEPCNRTITVYGNGGAVPPGSTEAQPMELFVGNAGTAARFLAAFVCLGKGVYRLSGVARMHERPQAALFSALRELGYRVESEKGNDKLPVKIFGNRSRGDETQTKKTGIDQSLLTSSPAKKCRVSIEESSQFASALLLSAGIGNWQIEIVGENAEESPYVAMTSKLMEAFPEKGGTFQIEPDASSGSYFWAADWVLWIGKINQETDQITVRNWPDSGWQIDADYPKYLKGFRPQSLSRKTHLGDSIMTDIVVAPLNLRPPSASSSVFIFSDSPQRTSQATKMVFNDLGRLRVQECDRVAAIVAELKKCGANIDEKDDAITVIADRGLRLPQDKFIETYHDHRMAMCFAILGLKVPGIKIKNPACVKKTFPNFFQKLAAPPPHGLGAEIWEIKNGQRTRKLSGEDLFAG